MAQQSHFSHVAQDYLCDIGLAIAISRGRNRAVTVIGAACALLFNGSTPMTRQISPLRQRMLDDMAFRNMSASAASADQNYEQISLSYQRYIACNERAVQAAAREPYPAYMLAPAIPATCRVEEEALKALVPDVVIEDLRARLQPWNEQAIERTRREQREGIMLIAPRSTYEHR